MLNFWIYQAWFCHQFWSKDLVQNVVLLWNFVEWCLDKLIFVEEHVIFAQFWNISSVYPVVCRLCFFLEVILHELDFLVPGSCGTYPSACWVWHRLLMLGCGARVFEILGLELSLRLRWGYIGHICILCVNVIQLPSVVLISSLTLKCHFIRIWQMHRRARVSRPGRISTTFRFLHYDVGLDILSIWREQSVIIGYIKLQHFIINIQLQILCRSDRIVVAETIFSYHMNISFAAFGVFAGLLLLALLVFRLVYYDFRRNSGRVVDVFIVVCWISIKISKWPAFPLLYFESISIFFVPAFEIWFLQRAASLVCVLNS